MGVPKIKSLGGSARCVGVGECGKVREKRVSVLKAGLYDHIVDCGPKAIFWKNLTPAPPRVLRYLPFQHFLRAHPNSPRDHDSSLSQSSSVAHLD